MNVIRFTFVCLFTASLPVDILLSNWLAVVITLVAIFVVGWSLLEDLPAERI